MLYVYDTSPVISLELMLPSLIMLALGLSCFVFLLVLGRVFAGRIVKGLKLAPVGGLVVNQVIYHLRCCFTLEVVALRAIVLHSLLYMGWK